MLTHGLASTLLFLRAPCGIVAKGLAGTMTTLYHV
jgi:hypothetical protein